MKKVSIETAVEDLKKIFVITESSLSVVTNDGSFMIDKRECDRFATIDKLRSYFSDKFLVDGQCRVEPITLLWTVFHIENLKHNEA